MVFEWLHMPSENGYNRRRHLSRTPPEFWSRHDRTYAGWERSKYIRARNKEYERHGGTRMTESAQRRFHARFPGGDGYYFPYAEALHPPFREQFRDMVDARRHGYKFKQDFNHGRYGDPIALWRAAENWADIDPGDDDDLDQFMSFVELGTGQGVEGPLGWGYRGDRPNLWAGDPWVFNRNGQPNGPFSPRGWHHWLGDEQPDDFFRRRRH